MEKVSCIIPAYNEEAGIGNVLRSVSNHPLISEIIVVDDFSKDRTREIAGGFPGVKLIVHENNKGKSQSVVDGVSASSGNIIFFLDADLIGLTPEKISLLINPVVSGQADISISLRSKTPWFWRLVGLDWLSGERVFFKALIENHLEEIKELPPFGLEAFLNKLIIKNKLRVKVVFWEDVESPRKLKKVGFFRGFIDEIKMFNQIRRILPPFGKYYQILKICLLRV